MSEVTRILDQMAAGSAESAELLLPAVYAELRGLAAAKIAKEQVGVSLAATDLVHEAYLRLAGDQSFDSRRHFFAAAAEAMRRVLIDRARSRNAKKRGGDVRRVEFDSELIDYRIESDERLEQLDLALAVFEKIEPEKAALVKLRYFTGMTIRESAEILQISTATADRHWAYSRAWLQAELDSR